jgi:alkaline phosphatase D
VTLVLVALLLALPTQAAGSGPTTVVLLVFDGFAPSLVEPEVPPALRRIQREGAFSHHVIPEFPTSDSVSTFTLSTGCRPGTHGIVNDEFIDPERGLYDGALDSTWLTACEHLHATARRQGLTVATWDWFDAEAEPPTRSAAATRVDEVVRALQRPAAERPRLLVAHFDAPQDVVGDADLHSEAARKSVSAVDAIVGQVMQTIEALPAGDRVTLIIATNHGLLPVWTEVNLTRILRNHDLDLEFTAAGATAFLYVPQSEHMQPAIRALSTYQRQFQVLLKRATPPEWNLPDVGRIGELILVAHPPYILESERRWWTGTAWLAPWLPEVIFARPFVRAAAGYPPTVRGMPGVLYVWGAGIAPRGEIVRLNLVDLHPTICRMLGIAPGNPVDGTVVADLFSAAAPGAR